jgi:uncharacterized membrane protein
MDPRPLGLAPSELQEGRVIRVTERTETEAPSGVVISERYSVDVGGTAVEVRRVRQAGAAGIELAAGDRVLVFVSEGPAGLTYEVRDRVRRGPILQLSLLFAGLVVIVGGWRGLTALLGLATTALVIGLFVVPGILAGLDPLLICISGALVIMTATLSIGHGPSRQTAVALGSTAIALTLGGLFSAWAVSFARLTGLTEDSATLQILAGSLDVQGLLLGGIILGAVGVLDDVTTTQAATVSELHTALPTLGAWELFSRAMNVGREHIAATTNTLLLAYAGTGLPLLVILAAQQFSPTALLSLDSLATEIVRTLVGSVAIVAAVPITTAIAAAAVVQSGDANRSNARRPW